jgi:uncharacterized membrane protein YidH (DUF202 family)
MDANGDARRIAREAKPWLIRLGRFGFAAKGVVYMLIGVLAVQAAVGAGGQTTDSSGALKEVSQAPFGKFLLIAIGLGIVGYALWRFIQAFMDTEKKGTDGKGLAVRVGYAVIACIHVGLAISAFAIASGSNGGNGNSTPGWTAQLMSQPFGQWLVGIVGGIVIAIAAVQFYRAYSLKFRRKLKLSEMSSTEDKWATRLGRIGYAARGIAFGIMGTFLVVAAIYADPQQARGLDGALDTLARQPWGWVVLGSVALGLIAYGIYMFVEARYRRMVIT